jgi:hypothetical protein
MHVCTNTIYTVYVYTHGFFRLTEQDKTQINQTEEYSMSAGEGDIKTYICMYVHVYNAVSR